MNAFIENLLESVAKIIEGREGIKKFEQGG